MAGKKTDADKQMTDKHPITPSPELMKEWIDTWYNAKVKHDNMTEFVAIQSARWGADQELEACCDQLRRWGVEGTQNLRNTRRLGLPSLKEQALLAIDAAVADGRLSSDVSNAVRRALEQLDD